MIPGLQIQAKPLRSHLNTAKGIARTSRGLEFWFRIQQEQSGDSLAMSHQFGGILDRTHYQCLVIVVVGCWAREYDSGLQHTSPP